jgi:hypothetical protein
MKIELPSSFSMSNFLKNETGITEMVWISVGYNEGRKLSHGPRINIFRDCSVTVAFSRTGEVTKVINKSNKEIEDMEKIREFIKINIKPLLDHWDMKIATNELCKELKPVS